MDIGITTFAGVYGMEPPAIGRAVEERGFESLFFPEHTHIPVHSRRPDGSSPRPYAETYDPFVALSAVAAVTRTLKLGTGVCLVTQRDPIVTAKQVACLDQLSGGRFLFGVGAGWNRMELANHGTDPRTRMALLAERVQAMRRIWTDDEAEFHGTYVDFDPIWSWPKPLQRPHPPVLVGGNGPGAEDRVLAFGDGWFPQCDGLADAAELSERAVALRRRATDTGWGRIPITVFNAAPDRRLLDALADARMDRCLLLLPAGTESQMLAQLDTWAPFASMWRQVT
ncbi:LLM class F420-dependent oxidoreductase [Sphaerisporangium corydalis]|uniref:LLM class F420-dependent oxidoreductase n=1 Tax=Sphaerisporangium corydalis TaxID=1441875 RepID=A0ABV9EQ54_9ACTN|nr:LLM class F420-dependent oxidoreductase [Sphaerisporangium corydalis]